MAPISKLPVIKYASKNVVEVAIIRQVIAFAKCLLFLTIYVKTKNQSILIAIGSSSGFLGTVIVKRPLLKLATVKERSRLLS